MEAYQRQTVAAGVQMGNTIISAYIVDCYPLQCMSVITFYAVFLNFVAFVNPVSRPCLALERSCHANLVIPTFQFFIAPWVTASGYTWTFAAQGIIVFFACVPILAALHWFGPSLRAKNGHPSWINPEYDAL
jgi:hypothetical protein